MLNIFANCSSLKSIDIPSSVIAIGDAAFERCSTLSVINMSNSVTKVGGQPFRNTSWYSRQPNGMIYIGKIAYGYKGTIPPNTSIEIKEETMSIAGNAFYGCDGLISVNIPNSVTYIGVGAFENCSNLASISIPNSVTNIGVRAFSGTSWYNNQPNGIIYAGKVAYKYKGAMLENTSIALKEGTVAVADNAFFTYPSISLTSLHIPSSVKTINQTPFSGCNFSTINVDPNNTTYDSRDHCNAIIETETNTLVLGSPNTVIPNSVTRIGACAFYIQTELNSIDIPNSVKYIEPGAFSSCTGLNSVSIPNGVTRIGAGAFEGCYNLTSISLPNSLVRIAGEMGRPGVFSECSSLTSITIPRNVNTIGMGTFRWCNNLTTIKVMPPTPPSIFNDTFEDLYSQATLYVPKGSRESYKSVDYWKEFKEIVEFDVNATITMGSSGVMTYSNNSDLNFTGVSGLKAYIASGFNPATGNLTMTRVYEVPAGEGLILKGAADSYEVPYGETSAYYANLLVGVPTATTVSPTDGSYTNFILANDEVKGIGFYPLASAGEIGPNKAYLQLPTSILPPASARQFRMVFEDEEEVAGINALNEKGALSNEKFFDLQGRRVIKPTRGLYIKDGKKIMVK